MVPVIQTGTKSPKEVDRAKETLTVEVAEITVMVAETTQLLTNMHSKEK